MAKSSTIYNPMVYLLFKPNFRKSLSQDTQMFRHRICLSHSKASPSAGIKDQQRQSSQQCNNKDGSISTPFSSGQAESYGACHVYAEAGPHYQQISRQITARVLEGTVQSEIPVRQLTDKMQNDLLWEKLEIEEFLKCKEGKNDVTCKNTYDLKWPNRRTEKTEKYGKYCCLWILTGPQKFL